MDYIRQLENKTIYIIRETYAQFRKTALLWSMGKDSTALLWMVRKAFFGKVPFPVIHIDTGYKFHEIYKFRDKYAKKWGLNLIISRNEEAIKKNVHPNGGKFECCDVLKTKSLKKTIKKHGFRALLLAIRRDEHGIRAKERYFSPRNCSFKWDYNNQPPEFWDLFRFKGDGGKHCRIHPMLHWTELDVWKYMELEKIPVVKLYFSKNGKRYRSIGCETCCLPVCSSADNVRKIIRELEVSKISERSGRAQDKEDTYTMQKLRSLGYM